MSEAAPSITRRALLGHAAAGILVAASKPAQADELETLIQRRNHASRLMCRANDLCEADPSPEREEAHNCAYAAHEAAYEALLRYRPSDLAEASWRFVHLVGRSGPWYGCVPDEWEISLVVGSMLPEAV